MPTEEPVNDEAAGPVGGGEYEVSAGECVISIAEAAGHFWQYLWDHPDNEQLKRVRKDPNVLLAGDRIHVPPIRAKEESISTEKRHRYRRRGVPSILNLVCRILDEPLANLPYTLVIDGISHSGTTDANGAVKRGIPCGARQATLTVGVEPDQHVYELQLGGLDPIETVTGQKARLNNLGYPAGVENNELTPEFTAALEKFQDDHDLAVTGKADKALLDKLKSLTC